jgi:hypothetical protein
MFRKLLGVAATVMALSGLGANSRAGELIGQIRRDGTIPPATAPLKAPAEVLQFLVGSRSDRVDTVVRFNHPLTYPVPEPLQTLGMERPAQVDRMILPPLQPTAELPLVPLPDPFWTGLSGLLGLALFGFCKNIRRILH